jgi:hypothetical protein
MGVASFGGGGLDTWLWDEGGWHGAMAEWRYWSDKIVTS